MNNLMQKIVKNTKLPMFTLKEQRAIYTFYSFYNHLKNVIESAESHSHKKELIKLWKQEIDNIYDKKTPASKIGRNIYKTCIRFNLPKEDLLNILDAVEMDISSSLRLSDTKKLKKYCKEIAGSPSSMLLRILGCKDEKLIDELSENMGQAFQITNILKNVRDDAEAGKLYIPCDLLKKVGIATTNPQEVVINKNLNIARQELAVIAEEKYKKTFDLIQQLDKKTSRNIKAFTYVYKKYFDMMNNRGWEIVSPKPKINVFSKLCLVLKAYSGK